MKTVIMILVSMLVLSCSHSKPPNNQQQSTDFTSIYQKYGNTHFIGIGLGTGPNEYNANTVAKAKALGELANNIKVSIMSKMEIITTDITINDKSQSSESIRSMILTIGNATVRSPEYEVISISDENGIFKIEVLAKKNKKEHLLSVANDLDFLDESEFLLELLLNKNN